MGFFSDIIDAVNGILIGVGGLIDGYVDSREKNRRFNNGEKMDGCFVDVSWSNSKLVLCALFFLILRVARHLNY